MNRHQRRAAQVTKGWVPLQRAHAVPLTADFIKEQAMVLGISEAEAAATLEAEADKCEYWVNHLYQVATMRVGGMIQLNIRRRDGGPLFRDWRHFQRIKNELVGPECEGVELYPAESRLVDTGNKFSIWCMPDPSFRFPFGWIERDVIETDAKSPGLRQRPPDEPGR